MLRYLGIPARVAVGFSSGTWEDNGWTVTDHDAHAWVEVWFAGHGWLPFDPTPGRGTLSATYTNASDSADAIRALGTGRFLGSSAIGRTPTRRGTPTPSAGRGRRRSQLDRDHAGGSRPRRAPLARGREGRPSAQSILVAGSAQARDGRAGRAGSVPRRSGRSRDASRHRSRNSRSSCAHSASAATRSRARFRGLDTGHRRSPRSPPMRREPSFARCSPSCASDSAREGGSGASSPCDRFVGADGNGTMRL